MAVLFCSVFQYQNGTVILRRVRRLGPQGLMSFRLEAWQFTIVEPHNRPEQPGHVAHAADRAEHHSTVELLVKARASMSHL